VGETELQAARRVERENGVYALEEEGRRRNVEGDGQNLAEREPPACRAEADRGGCRDALNEEEDGLPALQMAGSESEDVLVYCRRGGKRNERRANRVVQASGRPEGVRLEELLGGSVPSSPELAKETTVLKVAITLTLCSNANDMSAQSQAKTPTSRARLAAVRIDADARLFQSSRRVCCGGIRRITSQNELGSHAR
jgi:hypothetical protein